MSFWNCRRILYDRLQYDYYAQRVREREIIRCVFFLPTRVCALGEKTRIFHRDYIIRVKRFFFLYFFRGSKTNRKRTFICELPVHPPPATVHSCLRSHAPPVQYVNSGGGARVISRAGRPNRYSDTDAAAVVLSYTRVHCNRGGGRTRNRPKGRSSSLLFFPITTQ